MNFLPVVSHPIATKLQVENPLIPTGVSILLVWLLLSYHNSGAWKLRQFPTSGSSLPVLSFIGLLAFMKNTYDVVAIGRRKWPGRLFKVLSPLGWYIVITDPTHLDDIRKAPEDILSARRVSGELLQARFTLYRQERKNNIHAPIIKGQLTKEIPNFLADLHEEVLEACNQYLPAQDEWTGVIAVEKMTTIVTRAANRVFVGPILCKNPEWIKFCTEFTTDVVKTASLLNLFPSFLRPLVNYVVGGKVARRQREAFELLRPFIAARRDEKHEERAENSNDFLTWLLDVSEGKDREDWPTAARIFGLNFAAIHTSSMAVTHALLDLASNPEYLKPLREEVEEVTKREGWTKVALDRMVKVDSFVKESQRVHPTGVLLMGRYAMVDYTFSDGTFIPAGTIVGVSSSSIHFDPRTYEDPLRFDGFRFIKMKERAALDGYPDKKFDMVTTNADFVGFGQGRHACPGRFFATAEIKLMVAYIVTTYDVKLMVDRDDARRPTRPPNSYHMNGIQPDPTAKIYFRRRQ